MIAEKMIRIDVDLFDHATEAELEDTPVITGRAAAARLPPVHPFAALGVFVGNENSAAGFEQVFLPGKELIIRDQCLSADTARSQINQSRRRSRCWIRSAHDASRNDRKGRNEII